MYLIFDTETTGLPHNFSAPVTDLDNWPRMVQIAWQLHGPKGELISAQNLIVKPEGFTIPFNAQKVHGISTERALNEGKPLKDVLARFQQDLDKAELVIGHNVNFDYMIAGAEFLRAKLESDLLEKKALDTGEVSIDFCQLPGGLGGKLKTPKLEELYEKLFGEKFSDAHDAAYDVDATAKSFFGLMKHRVISPFDETALEEIEYESPALDEANFAKKETAASGKLGTVQVEAKEITAPFFHLHVHSQYSVLQAVPDIKGIIAKAKECNMPAVALTDLGNMFGAYKFVEEASANDILAIVGCEFYVAEERTKLKFTKDNPDKRFNQVLLAKNKNGYHNLAKLSSIGFTEGLYGNYPRIDKELIQTYKEDVIALTGDLSGEVPNLILNVGETQAEEAFQWWLEVFGDDFYVELIRHGREENNHVNNVLVGFAKKYGVKVVAANDVYYLDRADSSAHDVLLCVKEGEFKSTPVGRGRGFRYGFPNDEFYFRTQEEMKALFTDIPEAIENLGEMLKKFEPYKLRRDVLLPAFNIPESFVDPQDKEDGGKRGENAYLRYLTLEGAKKRYAEITAEIQERIDFELATIENTGYPGYFLIVQDFTNKAREMGVSVGPGRGSAAGSVVAYCIGITNVDPIKYDLLFERFLNPDRVSLPDIDIDFDDEGREKVIKYVIDKYGYNQVAQIITYGTMAAKSSVRDAGRVLELPLSDTDALAKLIPERPGTTLKKAFDEVKELVQISKGTNLEAEVLKQAKIIEGSVRSTGTHACGVIISPDDLTKYVPVATSKEADLQITQFDNSVVENAGMLKMDFLGLKTLSIIKTAIALIKERHGIEIDPDQIPLDDEKTYELYQRGQTNGTFQFESPGMQKHLRALKPDRFEDLIAMNALYRPGPMEYIPNFIARKHGDEKITYDLDDMSEYLAETYGITVYQEQVMLLSQKLAGFTKGEADILRKAMGKKKRDVLDKMKPQFIDQAKEKGYPEDKLEKIWKDWEAFAAYAFNKSHSTCYSVVAYHTAYLKANYPAEYMSAVLTHNQNNIDKVTFFMEECRNLGIKVLGPHVNESGIHFKVNEKGEIRFGLGAIKGTGESAVSAIIEERAANGPYLDIFDFSKRVNLKTVNKKTFEALAMSGAFDCWENIHRRQYLFSDDNEPSLIEKSIRYANKLQLEEQSAQASLFGGDSGIAVPAPKITPVEPFGKIEMLNIERDVVGLYISGHPLDQYKFEIEKLCNTTCKQLKEPEALINRGRISVGGIVTSASHRTSKNGKPFGILTIEDYEDSYEIFMFSDKYLKFKQFMENGWFLYLTGNIKPRWKRENEFEFNVEDIQLLSDVREKMVQGVELQLYLSDLNDSLINEITSITEEHKGNCNLKVRVFHDYEGEPLHVDLLSRHTKVNPDDTFIKRLNSLDEIRYSIVTA